MSTGPMISAGIEGLIPAYMMTYPERWGAQKQEFVRPAPKPLPSRYNGISNGTRVTSGHPTRALVGGHHPHPPAATPVNLSQPHKDDLPPDDQYYSTRVFQPPSFSPYLPLAGLYQSPYPLLRPTGYAPPPPLSPLDTYSPTTPTGNGAFLSPQVPPYSPPTPVKSTPSLLRDKPNKPSVAFKVPCGKEGSLKHRILTRPEDLPAASSALDSLRETRKRIAASVTRPRSPSKPFNNNNIVSAKFTKGSLIQLVDGKLRNVEDMRTEDFVLSAEMSPELRLAESTVIRIQENPITGTAAIRLSYNQQRAKVEVESPLDHPFFVYGHGWASCSVDRTLQSYGLKVHQLRVGDVLISLTPREGAMTLATTTTAGSSSATILTTSTTTAMTPTTTKEPRHQAHHVHAIIDGALAAENMRKRRWSAPDQICDEEEHLQQQQLARRMRVD